LGRKGVKCGSVTSCRGTAGPGIENYTQANKFVLRKGQLEEAALTGRIEGKRARGRQRGTLLGWLECSTGFRPLDLIKMMRERREEEAVTAAYARVLARHID